MADAPAPTAPGDPAGPPTPTPTPPTTPPAPTPPAQPNPANPEDALGDPGKRALNAERTRADAAEKERNDFKAQLEKLQRDAMSDQERALATAKDEATVEATKAVTAQFAPVLMTAFATGVLADPSDAARYLDNVDSFVKDGTVDIKGIQDALGKLVKDKPYLAAGAPPRGPGSIDGGGRAPAPPATDMNDLIRRGAFAARDGSGR